MDVPPLLITPIGVVRSPFGEKSEVPRQATAPGAEGIEGRIELLPEYEDALSDLEGFERIWILFWFDRATRAPGESLPSKVMPPRSDRKRGVFATRSPHRPNPIGMSAVRLVRVEGRVVHVRDLDLLDGTPVLDLKPYIRYADAFPDAAAGWLDAKDGAAGDPKPGWNVRFTVDAEAQLAWLRSEGVPLDLRARIAETLALGPQPHAYRRIKKSEDGNLVLAVKEWRAGFSVETEARAIAVDRIFTAFRESELANGNDAALALHRAFVARFG